MTHALLDMDVSPLNKNVVTMELALEIAIYKFGKSVMYHQDVVKTGVVQSFSSKMRDNYHLTFLLIMVLKLFCASHSPSQQ